MADNEFNYVCANLTLGISLIQIVAHNEVIIFSIFRFGCGFCISTLMIHSFADIFPFGNLQSIGVFVALNPAQFEEQWSLKISCHHPWGSFLCLKTCAPIHDVSRPRHRPQRYFIFPLQIKWTICGG